MRAVMYLGLWACFEPLYAASHSPTESPTYTLSFPDAAVSNVHTVYIPFTLIGQLISVQASVDGMSGNFIFDTGAERLILNQHYFESQARQGTVAALGNTGAVHRAKWHDVDTLLLSPLFLVRKQAHLVDLHHIELRKNARILGVIGYDVFSQFEVMIDFQNRILVLSRVNNKGARIDSLAWHMQPFDSIGFVLRKHLIVLDAEVNAVRLRMILDSGAELNLLDRGVNRKVLNNFTILKRVNLSGVGHQEVEVLAGILADVSCGKQYCEKMNTLLTNLSEFNDNFDAGAHGVLGYEFLHTRRTAINYQKQKVYFFEQVKP
jgi:hypothetical protein